MMEAVQEETAGQEFLRMVKESGVYTEPCDSVNIVVFGEGQNTVFIFSFGSNRIIYSDRGLWMNGKVIKNDHLKISILRLIQRTYCNSEEVTIIDGKEAEKVLKGIPLIPTDIADILVCKIK